MIDELPGFQVNPVDGRTLSTSATGHKHVGRVIRTCGFRRVHHDFQRADNPIAGRCSLKQVAASRPPENEQATVGEPFYCSGFPQFAWSLTWAAERLKVRAIGGENAEITGLFIQDKNVAGVVDRDVAHTAEEFRAFLVAPDPEVRGRGKEGIPGSSPAVQRSCRQISWQRVVHNE